MAVTLVGTCRRCGVPIKIGKDKYEEEGEYAYWYPTKEAQEHGLADDCYCFGESEPHRPNEAIIEIDDGFREVNLSAAARDLIAALIMPSDQVDHEGVFAADETWAEIRKAFPVGTSPRD